MRERKLYTRIYIESKFKSIIRAIKNGHRFCAAEYINELVGALAYMAAVEDITQETYDKVYKLAAMLRHKYNLY